MLVERRSHQQTNPVVETGAYRSGWSGQAAEEVRYETLGLTVAGPSTHDMSNNLAAPPLSPALLTMGKAYVAQVQGTPKTYGIVNLMLHRTCRSKCGPFRCELVCQP